MDIVELIQNNGKCGFSFEVLPPLKGKGIVQIYNAIDKLNERAVNGGQAPVFADPYASASSPNLSATGLAVDVPVGCCG